MYIYYFFGEGDDDENIQINSSDNQSDNVDIIQDTSFNSTCTPVYTESGEYTCAEYLVIEPDQKQTVEIEKTEEQIDYDETLLTTLQSIQENQKTIMQSQDETIALEIYEQINEKLENIYNYISIIVGLYFIGWIISTFNTWRRSNKN